MFDILEKARAFVQPLIRGFQTLKAGVAHTFEMLRGYEPILEESVIKADYEAYERAAEIQDVISDLKWDQLIPGDLHSYAPVTLSAKFKYDVTATYEDMEGNTIEGYWSVLSDERLSVDEVFELAENFPADSPPADMPMHGEMSLIGVWQKAKGT